MTNCWKVLGLEPTKDLELIKTTYRDLLKVYHPDKVTNQDMKVAYTAKCAQINAAYKEAVKQAEKEEFTTAEPDPYEEYEYYIPTDPWYIRFYRFISKITIYIFIFWAIVLAILYLYMTFQEKLFS